jgi:hypothetical protein
VQQPVNRQPLRRNCRRNRIDEKRHIVIDDGDAQMAPVAGRGFDLDQRLAGRAGRRSGEQPGGGLFQRGLFDRGITGKQRGLKLKAQGLDQRALRRLGRGFGRCGGNGLGPHVWLLLILRSGCALRAILLFRFVVIVSWAIPAFVHLAQA